MLLREDYCDGLGDCLPACPVGAIFFEKREAPAYDKAAVEASLCKENDSPLGNWPVQIKLIPVRAPYYDGADLLVAADCASYACENFQKRFQKGHVTLIGCPKLDGVDYSEKLSAIFRENDIKSVTVARMEVPCCRGMETAVREALRLSAKDIPLRLFIVSTGGSALESHS